MKSRSPWVFNTRYTCPLLMLVQGWVLWQKWEFSEHDGWQLLRSPYVIERCRFPIWLVNAEYRLWQRIVYIVAWYKRLREAEEK